ncbi:MAG: LCP family protein [Patescibacteria group bacterium]
MKKSAFIIFGVVLLVAIIFFSLIRNFYNKIYNPKQSSKKVQIIKEKTSFNILILGYGGGNHQGTFLTDTIILANIDKKTKKVVLISIPRDVWVKVPTKSKEDFHSKINSVYQIGLFPKNYPDVDKSYIKDSPVGLLNSSIKQISDLTVDNYITVDFAGFIKAIDLLGGIEVNVERTFNDFKYPVEGKESDLCGIEESVLEEIQEIATKSPEIAFPCRYETLHFDSGLQIMSGEAALKFARSRNSLEDGGDFGRAKRQQLLIEAVKDKVLSIGFIPKIIPLLGELGDHIETDIPLEQMQDLLREMNNAENYQIIRLVITNNDYLDYSISEDGQFILIPKTGIDQWDGVQKWIKNTINSAKN